MYFLHLQNVPDSADESIIRRYFRDLKIAEGGVEIVGGINGDVLITFEDDADMLSALSLGETPIHGCRIKLLLAQQADREQIIEKALKPSRPPSKRSRSSKSSHVADSSAPTETSGFRIPREEEYGKPARAMSPARNYSEHGAPAGAMSPVRDDYPKSARSSSLAPPKRDWGEELKRKLGMSSAPPDEGQGGAQRDWSAELKAKLGMAPAPTEAQTGAQRDWSAELKAKLGMAPAPTEAQTGAQRDWSAELKAKLGMAPAPDDGPAGPRRDWNKELKTKLLCATTQKPQLASELVRNALLKMNEPKAEIQPPPPPLPPVGPPLPPASSVPHLTAALLKNILRSTSAVQPPSHAAGAPYTQTAPPPQMLRGARPQMPPGQPWESYVTRPPGPPTGPAPNQYSQMPNTALPPPGFIRPPFRQQVPLRPPVVPPVNPAAMPVPTTLPSAVQSNSAQPLGSVQKQSRWGGMAVGASIQPPVTQNVSSSTVLARSLSSILPKTATRLQPLGATPTKPVVMNIKQKQSTVVPALKRKQTSAQPVKIQASEAIVITDSDSDSDSDSKGKRKKTEKSDRDKSQRVYRSKRSRSRSRSPSRSRRRSTSRGRNRSRSRERKRSRSRGRKRSRSRSRSRGRDRSRSRGRDRSRSRGRDQPRVKRERSRSKERDRGREPRQRPRNNVPDRTRKPGFADARPKVPKLLELPANKPVSLEMFINDPNSVIVQNVSDTVRIMVFRDFFYGHPIVRDGIVLVPSTDIPNSQTGYVKFVHQRDVEEVKQMSFSTLDGRKLLIKSCCEEANSPVVQTPSPAIQTPSPAGQATEVAGKVEDKSEGLRPIRVFRETVPTPKALKCPAPKESPFASLGQSDHITSYHVGIRGFKPGTSATEMWSWFGGADGHVQGIIVSHRIRKDDDELAFIMYGSKALRNTFRGPKHLPELVWHRYSEKAVIAKLIGTDVCYLTETTLQGQDREVSKAEVKHLRTFRPNGPTKPPLKEQEEDLPQTESSKPVVPQGKGQPVSTVPWQKLYYICLHETPKDISACKVWSWYGGEKGRAEGVIVANCKSKNELKGARFNVAFVGFRDPAHVQQEIDKRSAGQRYSSDGTMRFLARLQDSGMIFQSTTSGHDRVLTKGERFELRGKYLTQEELSTSKFEDVAALPPSWKEFELSEEFGKSMHFLQIAEPEATQLTACEAWAMYPPEPWTTRGAVVVKNLDGTLAFAYIAFTDNHARNRALGQRTLPSKGWKASWAMSLRRFAMYIVENGQEVTISTQSGVDRSITKEEKSYVWRVLQESAAWNTHTLSKSLITDPVEKAKELERNTALAAAADADKSDELFYLHLKRIPPKVTACEIWNWFYGASGNCKSVIVVYGTNGIAASAYIGFEREFDRDTERPKQKFSKITNYRSQGVRLLSLAPGFKATAATINGVDRVLTELDYNIVRWKLRKNEGIDGETAEKTGEATTSKKVQESYKERSWTQVGKSPETRAPLEARHQRQSVQNTQGKSINTVTSSNKPTHFQEQGKYRLHPSLQEKDTFKTPFSAPPGRPEKTMAATEQSSRVLGKPLPQHPSSQDKDIFKVPFAAPPAKRAKPATPTELSSVQGKAQPQPFTSQGNVGETITPYQPSPWVPVEQKKPQPAPSNLEAWQKLSYLCLSETVKGHTASQVWSLFGSKMQQVQCVILAHCTSQNELTDGSYHVAFVGFREPCILNRELDRLSQSKWYAPNEAMRFLARLPSDTPVFRALTFGHDRLLSKKVRTELQEKYLTEEELAEKQRSEMKPEDILTSIPSPEEFTFSEENIHGMLFVQHRVLPKTCTACTVWSKHQLDSGKSKGVVLLREADGTPHSAFAAYEDAKARAEALAKEKFTSKASWTCVVRRVSVLADRGFQVLMSTTVGKDRVPTEVEKTYMLHVRNTNTTPVNSDPMSTDAEPTAVLSTAAAIAMAASGQQTQTPKKDIAAAGVADKSDELFYLRIRKLPEKVTACQVWSWFQGASGNSKSAVVVYGANTLPVCAYVGFDKEMHRDMGVTNQRFSKACTYHSRSVFLVDLNPSFKVKESTVTGVDKELNADDFAAIKHKLQQNAVEKKKQKEDNTNSDLSCQQEPNMDSHASDSNGHQAQMDMDTSSRQPQMEIGKPVQQPRIVMHKNVHPSPINKDTPVYQSPMNKGKPVHQSPMNKGKPVHQSPMNKGKPVHQPPMELDNPVQQLPMEIDQPVQQPQMEMDKPVNQPPMEIDKPVQKAPVQQPRMDMVQLLASVKNLHEAENTIYIRLEKLRPNITAGEIWSWFRGSRGPTRCATLVREFDGTALFAYVGFVSDHTSYLENLELGTFSLCGPKARNIELACLHPSAHIVQSSKQGDKPVLPETLSLFKAGIMSGAKAATDTLSENQQEMKNEDM